MALRPWVHRPAGQAASCGTGRRGWTVGRPILAMCLASLVVGCSYPVHLQADHSGFLTNQEIQPLEVVARSTAATQHINRQGPLLPDYVFAFRPGFDVSKVDLLYVAPFTSFAKARPNFGRVVAKAIVERAADDKVIPSATLLPDGAAAPPGAYVLSGAVTRVVEDDLETMPLNDLHETSVAMRLSRDNDVLGVIQVNAVGRQPSPFSLLPTLIYSAIQGSRATLISRRIEAVFAELRAGHLTGAPSTPIERTFMPAQPF